jgi:hypothetical protein
LLRSYGLKRVIGLCGLCMIVTAGSALAEGSPFMGRWHWNQALSTLPAGEPVPGDMMAEFSRIDQNHVRWSITVTNEQGQPTMRSFDLPPNGEFYPISGDTTASVRVTGTTLQAEFKGPSDQSDTLTCTLTQQGKEMSCNGEVTGEDGKKVSYVDVYDRR